MLLVAGCETVEVREDDVGGPIVKLEITGLRDASGNPETIFNDGQCCDLQRTIPDLTPLTVVASAEDPGTGVRDIAVRVWAIQLCRFADGTSEQQVTNSAAFGQAGTTAGVLPPGSSAPVTRYSTANVRMADVPYGSCNPKSVRDASGQITMIPGQAQTQCGRRIFAVAQNGNAIQGASKSVLFTTGAVGTNNVPCP